MFQLLSSTRYDQYLLSLDWNRDDDGPCPFLLLPYHHERLVDAAKQHNWVQVTASLSYPLLKLSCLKAVHDHSSDENPTAFRIRITVSQTGEVSVSTTPLSALISDPMAPSLFNPLSDMSYDGPIVSLQIDSELTTPSIFTTTKTTHRSLYDQARARAAIPTLSPTQDVLLINENNCVMETSIFNVAFHRSSSWITPETSTGCLPGVLRRWLLSDGRIREDTKHELTRNNIINGEWVLLFNGVQGCRLGRVIDSVPRR
ncbi:hypothetical protein K435DRAFT_695017 [Dendrothele bispora CBS 962.96]|uniref:D-aminoacid aminotransferase-like PLP-dependent enzyme n=1 Tax=Dendrothele bispora (strain CBS 962.96) TaxID=1314807 RepID=A0A4S8KXU0_DENBC|nr:hypothetical protein K435DRAFT_695017 [Dendrothele bispora CBS 962.96]